MANAIMARAYNGNSGADNSALLHEVETTRKQARLERLHAVVLAEGTDALAQARTGAERHKRPPDSVLDLFGAKVAASEAAVSALRSEGQSPEDDLVVAAEATASEHRTKLEALEAKRSTYELHQRDLRLAEQHLDRLKNDLGLSETETALKAIQGRRSGGSVSGAQFEKYCETHLAAAMGRVAATLNENKAAGDVLCDHKAGDVLVLMANAVLQCPPPGAVPNGAKSEFDLILLVLRDGNCDMSTATAESGGNRNERKHRQKHCKHPSVDVLGIWEVKANPADENAAFSSPAGRRRSRRPPWLVKSAAG